MPELLPNRKQPCYDCGSTVPGHHTPLCDMRSSDDTLDLPQIEGTQWWTACRDGDRFIPARERPTSI